MIFLTYTPLIQTLVQTLPEDPYIFLLPNLHSRKHYWCAIVVEANPRLLQVIRLFLQYLALPRVQKSQSNQCHKFVWNLWPPVSLYTFLKSHLTCIWWWTPICSPLWFFLSVGLQFPMPYFSQVLSSPQVLHSSTLELVYPLHSLESLHKKVEKWKEKRWWKIFVGHKFGHWMISTRLVSFMNCYGYI